MNKKHLLLKDKKKSNQNTHSEKILIKKRNLKKKIKFNKRIITLNIFPKSLILSLIFLVIKFDIFLYKKISTKIKVCLCAIAKEQNLYIKYFLEHYKNLGYDHIFIYDNNDINDKKLEDVIKNYINNGFVPLIDYRGFKGKRNNPQLDAYYDCYENHNKKYDWLTFFDIDEYLILKPNGTKIHEFLENERYKNCPIIKINWVLYSDNDQIKYENKSVLERFTQVTKYKIDNYNIKSIMRANIPYYKFNRSYSPHYLYYKVKSCSTSGKFINGTYYSHFLDYKYAILNHYNTKTVTEDTKKLKKGIATSKLYLSNRVLKFYFNRFFAINNKTKEKV